MRPWSSRLRGLPPPARPRRSSFQGVTPMAHSAGCGRSTLPPTRARARSWTMSAEWHRRTAPRRALRASGGGRRCTSLAANQRARHHRRAQNDGGSKAANPLVPARQPRAAGGARVAPRTVTSTRYESVEIAARRRATGASRLCIGTGDLGNRAEGQLLLACPGHARLVAGGFHRLWAGDSISVLYPTHVHAPRETI